MLNELAKYLDQLFKVRNILMRRTVSHLFKFDITQDGVFFYANADGRLPNPVGIDQAFQLTNL